MRISELAERTGVPATTLRYYEDAGLLPAGRTPAGYRTYGDEAVRRLAFIGAGKHLGLSLDEIRELLPAWQDGTCAQVAAGLRPRVAARLADAERRAAGLHDFVVLLRAALARLDALPERPGPCGDDCAAVDEPAPVACSLTGGMAGRAGEWRRAIGDARAERAPGGVRVTLPAGRAAEVAGLAAAERECCPFLDFRLHFDGPDVHLDVRAPAGAAPIVDALFVG
ncbi:MerR family transcriptional regulator [Actinomadura algeriensis]|uniref:DNA-binding transcriptional MerR regulator n=1 Tax=Actinomadura algeriensis TaxID=1679523 RepID=A0ABR9JQ77_9ACTN|nr:MerR family transcriptional regulator [Actinomadura algeriensis]MBE1532682.1 DNA-binding transcriptional MerR regulator [Actinomadura algeriensis]